MASVSVIIPTYNRAKVVGRAIQSALDQGVEGLEVIVVDDGSTDNTREVLAAFGGRIRTVHQPNAGCSAARNTGLRLARSEWIAFLDSDDLWRPGKLKAQLEQAARHPSVGFWCGDCAVRDPDGNILIESRYRWNRMNRKLKVAGPLGPAGLVLLVGYNFVGASSALVRRDVLERAGPFSSAFPVTQDYDEWIRCAKICEIGVIPAPPYYEKTVGGDNLIRDKVRMAEDRFKVLLAHPDLAALGPDVKAAYGRALTAARFAWGEALVDARRYRAGWSIIREALLRDRSLASRITFLRVSAKKFLRMVTFGAVTREKFFRKIKR